MNILVYSWRDPKHPFAGGAEQVMHEHMKGWVAGGHKVTLFSSSIKGHPQRENLDGVKIIRSGYQYLGVQLAGLIYYLRNKNEYDIVVDQFHGIPFFTPLYVKKPILAVIQEPAREVWFANPLPWPLNWIIGVIGFIGEPFVFLFYKKIAFMTGSESAKKDLIKLGIPGDKINVIPHGVILPEHEIQIPALRLRSGREFETKTIVYLGVLSEDKGIKDAIKCFSILNKKGKFNFWIIGRSGTNRYMNKIRGLVVNLGLEGKVKFWGFVSQEKKFDLLSRSHILVNPSIREGWGLVNIEANAMSTPVIAYNSVGLIDSVKDGLSGIICQENSPENMAENVLNLTKNSKKYSLLQKGAIFWSRNFSWKKSQSMSLKLIQSLH